MRSIFFIPLLWLSSCGPATWEDLRIEGEAETKKFAAELKRIENKDDLHVALPKIKKRFNKLGDLLVKIRELQKEASIDSVSVDATPDSDELFLEIARIYEIPGGREAMESCQTEAVRKLDRSKKKS